MNVIVPIFMGSKSDLKHAQAIAEVLASFGIPYEMRIASAHKTPARLLEILAEYEADPRAKVFITIAGRSNALSGMADAAVTAPVIACPPRSDAFGGADIFSSLRMPSGVAPAVVLEAEAAALLAAKILALAEPALREKVRAYQQAHAERLAQADAEVREIRATV
ncbi:MAG: 5-(carboxyamino)imidazole ribonucleotide mutase [Ardenticatenia bacterium]|nr:MAG: 5-(carboxyamino)imidazole ribonucleotide mutase [Ardenticatenia bacterium]